MIEALGVCSWSMHAKDPSELADMVRAVGVRRVQIALDPIRSGAWTESDTCDALRRAGIGLASGMVGFEGEDYSTLESIRRTGGVRLDGNWERNLEACAESAMLARRLGLTLVTFHAGFLPHEAGDPERALMLGRLREASACFLRLGIRVAFETGQESASTLLGCLADMAPTWVGVNFDPANMILYGMGNPGEALRALGPRVLQAHVKDAVPAASPGTWGTEVAVGDGAVDWTAFVRTIDDLPGRIGLMIEREAGVSRVEDMARAARRIEQELPRLRERPGRAQ
ncbi:MAG: sugar phosphate isomerase/epimerase [Phycisphaerales bacterium]|nr:sugar phosphate isomerase/epimerase [Phycisphaerales bacterium]